MKDPLKNYIQDHRDEFDTLEVPEETFDKIMSRLNEPVISVEKTIPLFLRKKWIAAASIAIVFSVGTYILWNQKKNEKTSIVTQEKIQARGENTVDILNQKNNLEKAKIKFIKQHDTDVFFKNDNLNHSKKTLETKNIVKGNIQKSEGAFDDSKALEMLNNQYSASSRLQGIDLLKNFSASDEKIINILSEKALSDENTNVRLAAVEALSLHIENVDINKNIRNIFLNQDDPIVQKELIVILTKKNQPQLNKELSAKLKELTVDPTTAVFVKDEAYAVLMRY